MHRSSDILRRLIGVLAVVIAVVGWNFDARAELSQRDAAALSQASLIYIETVRKDWGVD